MNLQVPLFHGAVSVEGEAAALAVLRSGQIANGPKVEQFESAFGRVIERSFVVCVSDMSQALALALRLAGVGAGDDVMTLAFNCLSSTAPIAMVGANPVWVDINPAHATMDVEDLRSALTPSTKAVILYHIAGYPGPTQLVADFCREHGLTLIEDCNNALGATVNNRPIGAVGDYAVFSFYPNRQINAIDGAALVCPDEQTLARALRLRRFGIDARTFRGLDGEINPKSDVPELSSAASFNQLSAALALQQLPGLPSRVRKTQQNAALLSSALLNLSKLRPVQCLSRTHSAYWTLLVLAEKRDELSEALKHQGIQVSRMHYRNDSYSGFRAAPRHLPGTDEFTRQALALPCGWWLEREQLDHMIRILTQQCQ